MKTTLGPILCLPLALLPAAAQEAKPGPIQDNSFLVEEAYNQEPGVVQHITTFTRYRESRDWLATFTQEWPVPGRTHQLSFSIPYQRLDAAPDGKRAFGDVALNYRYQLLGDGEAKVAIAPRFTVLLPTGDEKQGRGAGAVGFQGMLPMSVVLTERFVTHWNLGATYTPGAKNARGEKADTTAWTFGESLLWLAKPAFNLLLEASYTTFESVSGPGLKTRGESFYLSPGVRWAYNFRNGLQVVPGIAVPIGTGPSKGERAIFLYLSFEHPMWKP